jgi:hypothetical protein
MWTVKDGEVGRSTPDAELPIMLSRRHVEFHDVGPTIGQYQSSNKRFSFSTSSFVALHQCWPNYGPAIYRQRSLFIRWAIVDPM